jgi:hypothetical protein
MDSSMAEIIERRRDTRFLVNDSFQVKVLFSSDEPRMLGKKYQCSPIDVSKTGLQLTSKDPIVVNSVLDLCISIDGSDKEFHLTGDVKWCRQNKSTFNFAVGIQLKTRAGTPTDLDDWKRLIKHIK